MTHVANVLFPALALIKINTLVCTKYCSFLRKVITVKVVIEKSYSFFLIRNSHERGS